MDHEQANPVCHLLTVVDGISEEIIDLIELTNFDLESFRQQFHVSPSTDPEMLDRYSVGPDDADFLCRVVGYTIPFDFHRYAYFIEAAHKDA